MMEVIHLLVVFMYMLPNEYVLGLDCGDYALGMQYNIMPADKITASSGTAGDQARLAYTNGPSWCAMRNDANPYLQIDLGTPHIICAVSTQGDRQGIKWVKTFKFNYSEDGNTYKPYSENGKTQQTFHSNVDGSGIVKQILYQGIIARYLRILPMMYHGAVCMRAEIYGVKIKSKNFALNKTAISSMSNQAASKALDGNRDGSKSSVSCVTIGSRNYHHWWGVDLGTSIQVSEVSVFTYSHPDTEHRSRISPFEIIIGFKNNPAHASNLLCGGEGSSYSTIPGNNITVVCEPPKTGRFVYIKMQKNRELTLCEVEVYGRENVAYGKPVSQSTTFKERNAEVAVDGDYQTCTLTEVFDAHTWWMLNLGQRLPMLGMKAFLISVRNPANMDYIIFVGNNQSDGGVYNPRCNKSRTQRYYHDKMTIYCQQSMVGQYLTIKLNSQRSYLQVCEVEIYTKKAVDCSKTRITWVNIPWTPSLKATTNELNFKKNHYICAVATKASYLEKYSMGWRIAGANWTFQTLTVNKDRSGIIKHFFPRPLIASVIRFQPQWQNKAKGIMIEVYGVPKEEVLRKSSSIGYKVLQSKQGSHVDFVCRAERGLKIKWYHNDTDITRYSTGTVKSGSTLNSTLRVNYTSADDVYEKYSCGHVIDQKRNCTSLDYICHIEYGTYRKYQGRGKVTVQLGVPNPPIVAIKNSSHSALIMMRLQHNQTADQGNIIKYSIELNEKEIAETNHSTYNLSNLNPYTNYTVRVMASSRIGNSKWSKSVTFTTLQAEPSAAPKNVKATKKEDGKYNVSWTGIPQEHANGVIVAYEINWKPVNHRRKSRSSLPSSKSENATKLHYLLDDLSLNVTYNVSIRGYTKAGPGPFSIPITIDKEAETKSKDGSSLASSSTGSFLLIIIAVAAVVAALIIIMIVMIVIIVLRKRHKKREGKEVRIHYEARTSKLDIEGPLIEKNEEEQNQNDIEDATSSGAIYGNLLNQAESKDSVPVEQFIEYLRKVWKDENQMLIKEFENMENGQQFPSLVARKQVNKTKNRYGNIVPYDHSRVVLEKVEEDEDSDYINASYIRGFDGRHISYIASQGPVLLTVADFWRMIWQEKTSVIVMLTGLKEGHKNKCEKYWPEDCETYLDISVQLQKTEVFADYSIRSFYLTKTKTSEQRCVFQYHFTAWPDKGVPQYATQLLAFRRRLVSETAMVSPWVVHCSAGVGRTGAFLAVDAMLRQAKEKKTIDILNFVKTMRENRPYMVQTSEQYVFVHTAILEFLTCGITEIRAQQLREEMNKLAKVDDEENLSGYEIEFKHLSHVCAPVQDAEITAGNEPFNNGKNRFPNIVPLDKARVFLQSDVDEEGANYINASYANGYRQRYAYILTQAPLDSTIADFWKMIYDNKLGTVVMLNNLQEGSMNYPKYWPQEGSEQFGDVTVEVIHEEVKNSIITRTLTLTNKSVGPDGMHEVKHYQHIDWSEGSVPNDTRTMLDLIEKLERSQQQSGNKSIVVQCSDGVGRSGTLCSILSLLDRVKTEQMVDVFQTVKALRISRPGAVETAVQYKFCFELVMSYLDSFSDYSNFND